MISKLLFIDFQEKGYWERLTFKSMKILTSSGCVGGLGIHDQINDTLAVFSSSFHALFTGNSKV